MEDLFGDLDDESPALSMDTVLGSLSANSSPSKRGGSAPVHGMHDGMKGMDPIRKGSAPTSEPEEMPSFVGAALPTQAAPHSGVATPPNTDSFSSNPSASLGMTEEKFGQAVFHPAPKPSPSSAPSSASSAIPPLGLVTGPPFSISSASASTTTTSSSFSNNHSSSASSSPHKSVHIITTPSSSIPSSPTSNHSLPSSPVKPVVAQEPFTIPSSPEQVIALLQAEHARAQQLAAANHSLESKVMLAHKKAEAVLREALARHSAEISKLKATFSQWAAKKKTEFTTVQTKLGSAVTKGRQLITENAKLKGELSSARRQIQEMEDQLKTLGVQVENTKSSKEKEEAAIVEAKSSYESELTELADALLQANQQLSVYETNEEVKRNVNVNISPDTQPMNDSPLNVEISIEGDFTIQWLRSFRGSCFQKIGGVLSTQKTYYPTVDDIGATLRVEVVTASGVELGAETGPVKCNPKMYTELFDLLKVDIRKNLKEHTFVVQSLGNAAENKKESLLLSKDKIKLKANNKTYAKAPYSEQVTVVLDENTRKGFTINLGYNTEPPEQAKPQHFTVGSAMSRDVIVLSVRLYNMLQLTQKNAKPPEQQYMLDEYIRDVTFSGKKSSVDSLTLLSRHTDMQVPQGLEPSVSKNKNTSPADGVLTRRNSTNVLAIAQRRTSFSGGVVPVSLLPKSVDAMLRTDSGAGSDESDSGNISGGSSGMFVVEPIKKTKEELEEEAKKKTGRDGVSNSAWDDIGGGGANDDEKWSDDEDDKSEAKSIKVTIDMSKEVKKASVEELKMMALGNSPRALAMGTGKKKKKKKVGSKKSAAVQALDMNTGAGQSPTKAGTVTASTTSTKANASPTSSAAGSVDDSCAPSTPEKEAGPNGMEFL
eukprot:gb/GEZN01001675.1/.p1 GENE.gb/GEZN01001675.1/~~gb/GEZN01001675.1/.p1  ORF type:complete len:882 (+),score=183.54 gb/GEZN01001675.1/:164-2809(+)